jgi:hypothetical protein
MIDLSKIHTNHRFPSFSNFQSFTYPHIHFISSFLQCQLALVLLVQISAIVHVHAKMESAGRHALPGNAYVVRDANASVAIAIQVQTVLFALLL